MQYHDQLLRITSKFERLRALDQAFRIGESGGHQYELNPPAPATLVAALEQEHSISLPGDYRFFVTQFADGGAGPAYGLFTIEESFADHLVPSLPFPYDAGKRVPYSDDQTEDDLKELCAFYDDPRNEHGKLVIGEIGCGIMIDLIVNGRSKGQVWIDDRTYEWGGLYPYDQFGNSEPLTFMGWYEAWLDDSLTLAEEAE